jgi:hypothetical protein
MFVPHRRNDAEFGKTRRAAEQRDKARIFVRLEPVAGHKRVSDFGFGRAQIVQSFVAIRAPDSRALGRRQWAPAPQGGPIPISASQGPLRRYFTCDSSWQDLEPLCPKKSPHLSQAEVASAKAKASGARRSLLRRLGGRGGWGRPNIIQGLSKIDAIMPDFAGRARRSGDTNS